MLGFNSWAERSDGPFLIEIDSYSIITTLFELDDPATHVMYRGNSARQQPIPCLCNHT